MADTVATRKPDHLEPADQVGPRLEGRLAQLLNVRTQRGKLTSRPEQPMRIDHRESLIYVLGKAAELEHLVVCQYLYAAFSLKRDESEGLTTDQIELTGRWRHQMMEIAEQEMLHLALVQNLLTAVGAGPHFNRPSFPLPPRAFPAMVQMSLLPFDETALRHFAFLERPEGMDMDDAEGFAALERATPVLSLEELQDEIGPNLPDFETIGHLYRSIEDGLTQLVERVGEEALFIGPKDAQATGKHFRWDELGAVTDLASARKAIDTIVEQGEGARGDWHEAHFGRILAMLDEYLAAREADPGFAPARAVLPANVRPPDSGADVPIITDPFTIRCADLLNAVYEVLLQLLSRYFAHSGETDRQLGRLADVSVGLMEGVLAPLGYLVARLPVGPDHPGRTTGPTFELFYAVDYLLPHRDAAWRLMEERLREVAELAVRCREVCVPLYMTPLSEITAELARQADRLASAR